MLNSIKLLICLLVLLTVRLGTEGGVCALATDPGSSLGDSDSAFGVQEARPGSIPLKQGELFKSEIRGGSTQSFSLLLTTGQYGQVIVRWQGMDLNVFVRKPDQTLLFPTSIPVRGTGPIPIIVPGEQTGAYTIEVSPTEQVNILGNFDIIFSDQRFPTDADLDRFKALSLMAQGQAEKAKPEAIAKYTKALALWQSAGDPLGRAYALQRLGNAHLSSKDVDNAEKYYRALLELRQSLSDPRSLIYTRREIGQDFRAFVSPSKAIEYYQSTLQLARDIKDRRAEAALLYSMGYANQIMGLMHEALKSYDAARRIQHEDRDRLNEARTLNAMGGAHSALGDQTQALSYLEQALAVFTELGDLYRVGIGLNNIGLAYDDSGDLQKARDKYLEALGKFKLLLNGDLSVCKRGAPSRTLDICDSIANTYDNIGELFNTTGDPQSALEIFQQSLPLRETLEQPRPMGLTLTRMGYSYVLQRQPRKAIEYCEQGLAFNKKAEDLRNSAYSLTILGMAHSALNQNERALEFYQQALSLQRQTLERRGEGITLNQLGALYLSSQDYAKAVEAYHLALKLWRDTRDEDGETITLFNIAKLERDRGDFSAAHKYIQQAITIVENRRATLNSQRLLATYFASKQDYYDLVIDVEMNLAKMGNADLVERALEANERARGRRLLDALLEARILRTQDPRSITSQNPALKSAVDQQQTIAVRLSAKANARTVLLAGSHNAADEKKLNAEIEQLAVEYDDIDSRIRTLNPAYASLVKPQPLKASEIKEQLDDDTLLIEYALGEKRSYVWTVTRESIQGFELPSNRNEIEEVATQLSEVLRTRGSENENVAQKELRLARCLELSATLSRMILDPIGRLLRKKRLAIVSDGALQLIPFAVLPSPQSQDLTLAQSKRFLIEDYEIVNLPSASVLAVQRSLVEDRKHAPMLVAVVADPVFDQFDERIRVSRQPAPGNDNKRRTARATPVSPDASTTDGSTLTRALDETGIGTIAPLYFSRAEARSIVSVAPKGQAKTFLGFQASRSTVVDPELARYKIIHFATHAILNSRNPQVSGLVLSMVDEQGRPQNGYLQMHEIYNLNLPAELVVLSACQTGTGKLIRGEGLMALTRGFMYAGATGLVASLWKVDDAATAALMARFYKEMFTNGKRPVAALRDAQVSLAKERRWKSPYHWGGFVLQGEWK